MSNTTQSISIKDRILRFFGIDVSPKIDFDELERVSKKFVRRNRLKTLILNMVINHPKPFWVKSEDGRMVFINPAYERTYGKVLSEYAKGYDADQWGEDVSSAFRDNDMMVLEYEAPVLTTEVIGEGKDSTYLVVKYPVKDSNKRIHIAGESISVDDIMGTLVENLGETACHNYIKRYSKKDKHHDGQKHKNKPRSTKTVIGRAQSPT